MANKESSNGRMRTRRRKPAIKWMRLHPDPTIALRDDLELVAMDAMRGGLADSLTVGRVKTAVRAELLRRGHGSAHLECALRDTSLCVTILLHPGTERVQRVVLTLD